MGRPLGTHGPSLETHGRSRGDPWHLLVPHGLLPLGVRNSPRDFRGQGAGAPWGPTFIRFMPVHWHGPGTALPQILP